MCVNVYCHYHLISSASTFVPKLRKFPPAFLRYPLHNSYTDINKTDDFKVKLYRRNSLKEFPETSRSQEGGERTDGRPNPNAWSLRPWPSTLCEYQSRLTDVRSAAGVPSDFPSIARNSAQNLKVSFSQGWLMELRRPSVPSQRLTSSQTWKVHSGLDLHIGYNYNNFTTHKPTTFFRGRGSCSVHKRALPTVGQRKSWHPGR